jgi:hypothetical protein
MVILQRRPLTSFAFPPVNVVLFVCLFLILVDLLFCKYLRLSCITLINAMTQQGHRTVNDAAICVHKTGSTGLRFGN